MIGSWKISGTVATSSLYWLILKYKGNFYQRLQYKEMYFARWISLMLISSLFQMIFTNVFIFLPRIAKKYSLIIISCIISRHFFYLRPIWHFKLGISRNESQIFVKNHFYEVRKWPKFWSYWFNLMDLWDQLQSSMMLNQYDQNFDFT